MEGDGSSWAAGSSWGTVRRTLYFPHLFRTATRVRCLRCSRTPGHPGFACDPRLRAPSTTGCTHFLWQTRGVASTEGMHNIDLSAPHDTQRPCREPRLKNMTMCRTPLNPPASAPRSVADRIEFWGHLLTVQELAFLLGYSVKALYAKCAKGTLPHSRIDGSLRFDPVTTSNWLRSRTT